MDEPHAEAEKPIQARHAWKNQGYKGPVSIAPRPAPEAMRCDLLISRHCETCRKEVFPLLASNWNCPRCGQKTSPTR